MDVKRVGSVVGPEIELFDSELEMNGAVKTTAGDICRELVDRGQLRNVDRPANSARSTESVSDEESLGNAVAM